MEPFKPFESSMAPLPIENIDTDQIIAARYLKVTDKNGLAEGLFYDWRQNPDFVLNQPEYKEAKILLAGDNFGAGSSREHAPWALVGYGFQAVISTGFADIFKSNSLKNGLLPIVVDKETHQTLFDLVEEAPHATIKVDLAGQTITLPGGQTARFPIDAFSKECLLQGVDQLGYLMNRIPETEAYEAEHPARIQTRF
ncbi:MAG TPA: 3-isopropylmalate dehydratase small subunit [Aggregatilineales bacterium]|nr:3-isopropylmalate dehydratase small subunit [Aggregatilineales bacterium]